ncbi:nucleotidyltransferase family protein [Flavitalea antarctica]
MMNSIPDFAIIILAAGQSSRMGEPKQLLVYENATLLERAVQTASAVAGDKLCVVLGANANIIKEQVPNVAGISVFNENWKRGMGTSIAVGLQSILDLYPNTKAVIIMAADQPFVNSGHLHAMITHKAESHKPIVASAYKDAIGIPALFDEMFFEDLLNLETDKGAKDIIITHEQQVASLPLPGGEIDIDTPEQFDSIRNKIN